MKYDSDSSAFAVSTKLMTSSRAAQLEAAQRLLALDATAVTEAGSATVRGYRRLDRALGPIIGTTSVRSIFARSLKLSAVELVDLASVLAVKGYADDPAAAMDACLASRSRAEADELCVRVFAVFFELLAGFIGERLTTQVMDTAWMPSEETKP